MISKRNYIVGQEWWRGRRKGGRLGRKVGRLYRTNGSAAVTSKFFFFISGSRRNDIKVKPLWTAPVLSNKSLIGTILIVN